MERIVYGEFLLQISSWDLLFKFRDAAPEKNKAEGLRLPGLLATKLQ